MSTEAPEAPAKKRPLFAIGEDLLQIEKIIEDAEKDIDDPDVDESVKLWLQDVKGEEAAKLDGYVNLIRKWDNEAAAAKAEADQYAKARKVRENRVERLKVRLKEHMEATGQTKIVTASSRTIAIQKNGGLAPLFITDGTDPVKLDPRFQNVVISINNDGVRDALDAGEELAFASLGQRGTSLRIR